MTEPTAIPLDPAEVLGRSEILASLSHEARQELATYLERVEIPAGKAVIREGEEGNHYYLILQGEAEVWARKGARGASREPSGGDSAWTPDPDRYTLLARLGPGDGFGEMALLLGGPRRATVLAATDLVLCSLDGAKFTEVVNRHRGLAVALEEEMALRGVAASLGKASPFAKLPPESLRWLATRVQQARFEPGDDIVRQGDPGDAFYVIRAGRVAILVTGPDDAEAEVATLVAGEPFGEQALLTGEPRSATVRALEPTEVFRLARDDFDQVLRQYQERRDYFARLVLQRQRPQRIEEWALEHQVGRGGQSSYILKDPRNRRYLRLSEEAAFLWELMDGQRTVRDLTLAYFSRYQLLGLDAVLDAMMQLHAAGFLRIQRVDTRRLEQRVEPDLPERLRLAVTPWLTRYFSLPDVDRGVTDLYRYLLGPIYSRKAQAALLVATLLGTALFASYLARGELELPPVISLKNLAASVILSIVIQGLVHETIHAATCKHFGREVHSAGVGWYFFLPVAYVDTSDIWMSGKGARVTVALAGPYANFAVAALATLLIPLVESPGWSLVLFQFAAIGYALGLTNLNPLAEFDGYYALADWLQVPNLRSKALAFLGSVILRVERGLDDARLARIYVAYGVLALLYMVLVPVLLLVGYRGYLEELVGRALPSEVASALGWVFPALVVGVMLQRGWVEIQDSMKQVGARPVP